MATLPIPLTEGITHSVLLNNDGNLSTTTISTIVNVPGASLIKLRTMPDSSRITSLSGRLIGTRVDLNQYTVFDYEMRRKAEALQYKKNQTKLTKKQKYAQISNIGTKNSVSALKHVVNNSSVCRNLDIVPYPPTNSGVHDYKYPGYFYNVKVPYLPNL